MNIYISTYMQFARYLQSLGYDAFIPEKAIGSKNYSPYIFHEGDLVALIQAVDAMVFSASEKHRHNAACFSVMLRMYIGCGFRLNEIRLLKTKDVDLEYGIIHVRNAKGNRDRIVPMHETLEECVKIYSESGIPQKENLFFPSGTGTPISCSWIRDAFVKCIRYIGIEKPNLPKHSRNICLHCLRHSFAVAAFRRLDNKPTHFQIEFTKERIIPSGGLTLVGYILENSGFIDRLNKQDTTGRRSGHQIKNGDILGSYIGCLCMGKPDFEAIRETDDDPEFFCQAMGIKRVPSPEILRQRMDGIGCSMRSALLWENVNLLVKNHIFPSKIPCGFVTVDIDVTPCDNSKTKKEGVSRTYKGCDGYAPMMAYIGREGYLINCELRKGSQHCQKHTPEFLRETINACRKVTEEPLLFRLDSGNDSTENIGIFLETGCSFITKRNLRRESREGWLQEVKDKCLDITNPRDGKTVYIGSTWRDISYVGSDGEKHPFTIRTVYEITERNIDKQGQYLFPADVEINMWDVNVDLSGHDIIALYHAHGESEQFHSEIKTDMDLERFPSGKFDTNELVLGLAMLAYNILRMVGDESIGPGHPMKHPVKRRRIGTVIKNLEMMACHITKHGRRTKLGLGRSNIWRKTFQKVHLAFSCL